MKKNLFILLFFIVAGHAQLLGQENNSNELLRKLETASEDTNRVWLLLDAAQAYYFSKPDSCLMLSLQGLELSRQLSFKSGEIVALNTAGEAYRFLGDYPHSLEVQFKARQLNQVRKNIEGEAIDMGYIGFTYLEMGEYRQALQYLLPAKTIHAQVNNTIMESFVSSHIGHCYTFLDKPDSALTYNMEALSLLEFEAYPPLRTLVYDRLGIMYEKAGNFTAALDWYHKALFYANISGIKVNISRSQKLLASLHFTGGQADSAIYYARLAYANSKGDLQKPHTLDASLLLSKIFYQKNEIDSAYYYQGIAMAVKDSIYGADQFRKLQLLMLDEQKRKQDLIKEQTAYRNKIKYVALFLLLGFLAILAIVQRRNNLHKQKINQELNHKKENLENTLSALKSAQSQLIQSEKMASLGELTAGIAHEIQNPLNFVNNFAEINNELIADLKDATEQNDQREILRLADQLKENQEKIKLHGKRADGIVKSMLQHSRAGSGSKEMTDVNKMVDEYVRLSFHGMRARDKSFNTELDIRLDPALGKIPLLPQDFGRVLLNLLNNAFYSVNEKKKISGESYKPKVSISTQLSGPWNGHLNSLQLVIADNGKGIPAVNKEKIFQPFFTTKPTGEGTGLGLSLSYDIIRNGHDGSLSVESVEGEGAEFMILLPLQQ
jgi:signal transduction histidine kinase